MSRFSLFSSAAARHAVARVGPGCAETMNEKTVMVGGAPMYPSKNIVQNAVNSKDHTTLVAAVKAAGLVDTLQSAGPFTVFAPTNAAFAKLPAGTVDNLVKPENKDTLTKILTYHVVPGPPDGSRADEGDQGRRRHRQVQDRRRRRHLDQAGGARQTVGHRRQRRRRNGDHRRCPAVERRYSRHRHGAVADVTFWMNLPRRPSGGERLALL